MQPTNDTSLKLSVTLPVNPDIEDALIGSVLMAPKLWPKVAHVRPSDFHSPAHASVWEVMAELASGGSAPDLITVTARITAGLDHASDEAMAWRKHLHELTLSGGYIAREAQNYAAIVRDYSERRRLIWAMQDGIHAAADTAAADTAAQVAGGVMARITVDSRVSDDIEDAYDIAGRVVDELDRPIDVVSTGMPRLDAAMGGGIRRGTFIGIGGDQKAGKSTLLGSIAYNLTVGAEERGVEVEPLVYLCLEMKPETQLQRLMGRYMGMNSEAFTDPVTRAQPWFKRKAQEAQEALRGKGLFFAARPRMTLDDLKGTLARIGLSKKFRGAMVDYVQLVGGKRSKTSMAEHLDDVNQTIAETCVNTGLWVMAAAQLNSEGKVRGGSGLNAACDIAFAIRKHQEVYGQDHEAHLENLAARYTRQLNVGSENCAAYRLRSDRGPFYDELELPPRID